MDEKKLQQEFIQFLSEKLQAKDEQDLRDKVKNLSQDDMEKYYEEFSKKKLKKAAHGAKLGYFKRLKHQCAEDEELVYFKKGGSVGCGCVKKEEGGKTPTKKKVIKQDQATKDSIAANVYNDEEIQNTRPGSYKNNKNGKLQWTPDRTKAPYKKENGGGLKKNCGGATIKLKKKGGEVCPKCGKIHAAGTGCAVSKLKRHYQGGSLNGIPFMQKGTTKGGLPTAPKAEDRYKNGYKYGSHLTLWSNGDGIDTRGVVSNNKIQYGRFPAVIQREIRENSNNIANQDTTYQEAPDFVSFPSALFQTLNPIQQSTVPALIKPKVKIRKASSKDKNKEEYEILKRRFNTAWNLAK